MNHSGYAWRRFLIACMEALTSSNRQTAFIFNDSMFARNRSKAVEDAGTL
nr:hypothetical protein [Paenibacillus curdlanolyticus]